MKKLPAKITYVPIPNLVDFKKEVDSLAVEAEQAMEELDFQRAFTKIQRIVYLGK